MIHLLNVETLVSAVPPEDERHPHVRLVVGWHISRELDGTTREGWTVEHGRHALSKDGAWRFVPRPSEQDDEWQDAYWFTYEEAIQEATRVAPEFLARWNKRYSEEEK